MLRLCSGSPTRASMLKEAKIAFVQMPADFDEDSLSVQNPKSFVYFATQGKLQSALALYDLSMPILVADTVISVHNTLIRKAKDKEDARQILALQSGNLVSIISCFMLKSDAIEVVDISATHYRFKPFDSVHVQEYLQSGEWEGKAGACMVEGFCKRYIQSVEGLESTAMGLTVEKIVPFLTI